MRTASGLAYNPFADANTSEKLGAIVPQAATGVWKNRVKDEGRFISVSIENLFGNLSETQLPEMKSWLEYIHARYPWVREK